jgi:hypothetical protein
MPSKKKETKEAVIKEPVMYVGPTAHKYGLIQNTVYSDIPETAKPMFEAVPLAGNLIIRIKDYAKAERDINERKGITWQAFLAVLNYVGK